MEQRNKNTSSYSKIRQKFYKRIKEIEKKEKRRTITLALGSLLLASILLFASALIETSGKGKYIYVYGDYEQSISTDLCFDGDVQLIDLNALANYCGFDKEEANYVATFRVNNTYISIENGSKIATINGINKEMPAKAQIKNGYCLIPLSTALDTFYGLQFDKNEKSATVTATKNMYIIDKNPKIEYATDISRYLEYISSTDEYIYILLNKQNPIDEEFEPADLVVIPEAYSRKDMTIKLHNVALQALEAMINDMNENGITDVHVQSAYRTHSYQDMLFNLYIEREMEKGLTREEATANANKYSAKAEYSEHRTGLCVDFSTKSIGGAVDDVFETTEAFTWLKENSWKYGFIMRYPEDKENITGYMYESWHYRFVGLEVASIMHQTGICYEEYLEIFGNE